jgi:hypothetical protein
MVETAQWNGSSERLRSQAPRLKVSRHPTQAKSYFLGVVAGSNVGCMGVMSRFLVFQCHFISDTVSVSEDLLWTGLKET